MTAETQRQSSPSAKTDLVRFATFLAAGCLLVGCRGESAGNRSDYQPSASPAVSSTRLAGTEIVPTLDTPLAESGNAVWCATLQVAWNHARDDVFGGPLQIANAEAVGNRLNNSPVTEAALPPDDYFAAAGRLEDGIIETIRQAMARQFPGVQLPSFDDAAGFVAYGYLDTRASFTTPFVDTNRPIQFSDAAGVEHAVRGFGLQMDDWDLLAKQTAQVKVLFSEMMDGSDGTNRSAFALDLTADNESQQVIVAVLPRAIHLRGALDELSMRIETFASDAHSARLREADTLAIPNVAFHVIHEFAELRGRDKIVENAGEFQGLPLLTAAQSICFRLDKSGAAVISESLVAAGSDQVPRRFVFDRPFLAVMKRRSADEPYFVAWIDNAELLEVTDAGGDP